METSSNRVRDAENRTKTNLQDGIHRLLLEIILHNVNKTREPTDRREFQELGCIETNIHDSEITRIQDLFRKGANNKSQLIRDIEEENRKQNRRSTNARKEHKQQKGTNKTTRTQTNDTTNSL